MKPADFRGPFGLVHTAAKSLGLQGLEAGPSGEYEVSFLDPKWFYKARKEEEKHRPSYQQEDM